MKKMTIKTLFISVKLPLQIMRLYFTDLSMYCILGKELDYITISHLSLSLSLSPKLYLKVEVYLIHVSVLLHEIWYYRHYFLMIN